MNYYFWNRVVILFKTSESNSLALRNSAFSVISLKLNVYNFVKKSIRNGELKLKYSVGTERKENVVW